MQTGTAQVIYLIILLSSGALCSAIAVQLYKNPGSFVKCVLISGLHIRTHRESSRKQKEKVKNEESQSLNSS